MKIHPGNAQDIGTRQEQQDSFSFSNPEDSAFIAHAGLLAILADGMGGMANGGHASSTAVRSFLREYERKTAGESIPSALRRALAASSRDVVALNSHFNIESGSTLIGASVCSDHLYWISVGDSHIYLLRDGELIQLNRDHTFGQALLDAAARGEIALQEVGEHPDKEHLTSYLGMRNLPEEVDSNPTSFPLQDGDQVLLCSDGVYRMLGAEEFIEALDDPSPSSACERIRQIVLSKRHPNQDNLTMLILRCGEHRPSRASLQRRWWTAPLLFFLVALNLAFGLDTYRGWKTLHKARKDGVHKSLTNRNDEGGSNAPPKQTPTDKKDKGTNSKPGSVKVASHASTPAIIPALTAQSDDNSTTSTAPKPAKGKDDAKQGAAEGSLKPQPSQPEPSQPEPSQPEKDR